MTNYKPSAAVNMKIGTITVSIVITGEPNQRHDVDEVFFYISQAVQKAVPARLWDAAEGGNYG